jgi:hypothetical protein
LKPARSEFGVEEGKTSAFNLRHLRHLSTLKYTLGIVFKEVPWISEKPT